MGVAINNGKDVMNQQRKNDHGKVGRIRKNFHRTQHERRSYKYIIRK